MEPKHFNNTQLTEKKRKQIRALEMEKQIAAAQEELTKYGEFVCNVAPEQTLEELKSLEPVLLAASTKYRAVLDLISTVKRQISVLPQVSVERRIYMEKILVVATGCIEAADKRMLISKQQKTPQEGETMVRGTSAQEAFANPPVASGEDLIQLLTAHLEQQKNQMDPYSRTSSVFHRKQILSPVQEEDYLTVLGSPPPRTFDASMTSLPPQMSLDRGPSTLDQPLPPFLSRPNPASPPRAPVQPVVAAPERPPTDRCDEVDIKAEGKPRHSQLTLHSITQQELKLQASIYEARLDNLQKSHAAEKEDMAAVMDLERRAWEADRRAILEDRDKKSESLKLLEEKCAFLEDSIEKLKEVVHVVTARLQASEDDRKALRQQQTETMSALLHAVGKVPPALEPLDGSRTSPKSPSLQVSRPFGKSPSLASFRTASDNDDDDL